MPLFCSQHKSTAFAQTARKDKDALYLCVFRLRTNKFVQSNESSTKSRPGCSIATAEPSFGVVPKRGGKSVTRCNEDNFYTLSMRCLLADTGTKAHPHRHRMRRQATDYLKYFDIRQGIRFEPELNRLGYTCADITDVVLTHLHFDHCGGCTYYINKEKGELAP